jgi:hypothetical protein
LKRHNLNIYGEGIPLHEIRFNFRGEKLFMEKTEYFNLNEMTLKAQQEKDERINKLKIAVSENLEQAPNAEKHCNIFLIYEAVGMIEYAHLIGDITGKERDFLNGKCVKVLEGIFEITRRSKTSKAELQDV